MNYKNLSVIGKIILLLVIITSMYGFVSYQQIPFYQLFKSFDKFTIESFFMGKTFLFLETLLLALLIMNPIKVGLFFGLSTGINILIFNLLGFNYNDTLLNAINFGIISGISAFIVDYVKVKEKRSFYNYGLIMGFVPIIYAYFIVTSLNVMSYILPNTNDIQAIFIDNLYHIPRSINQYFYFFNDYIEYKGIIYQIIFNGYNSITISILLLAIWEYSKENKRYYTNTIVNSSVLLFLGILVYILFPIMGPKYLQLSLESVIKDGVIDWTDYIGVMITGTEFPRNGMPSMHFGLTLFAFLNSKGLHWIKRTLFLIFFIVTAIATIVLGEHYFIDWIGALPIIIISMLISDTYINFNDKKILFTQTILNLIVWYLFLWYGVKEVSSLFDCLNCSQFNITMTSLLYLISAVTIINFVFCYKKIYKIGQKNLENNPIENIDIIKEIRIKLKIKKITEQSKISGLFIISGFAGLMYQVIFGKILSTTFGSTSLAIYTILATYMIGLSLGSWFGGKIENKTPAILKYAICEGLIALYCVMTPFIFKILDSSYIHIVQINPESIYLALITKTMLGIFGLIIPTILMGMTTPILLREFNKETTSGISLAKLYTLNTLGAAIGSILSGYILIQLLGVQNSIYVTVLLNLIIAGIGISLTKNKYDDNKINSLTKEAILELVNVFKIKKEKNTINTKKYLVPLGLLFFSGLITMIMETIYVHGLAIVVGNSTYVFSIMLFTFLLGLSFGGYLGKQLMTKIEINSKIIGIFEVILGITIYLSFNLIDKVPNYFSSFGNSTHINTFESQEFLKFIVCFGIMILPTIMTGIIYTLSMGLLTQESNENNSTELVGKGLSINTIGNILGIFIGGFIFINIFQLYGSFKLLTCLTIFIGLLLNIKNKKLLIINMVTLAFILMQSFSLNMKEITSGSNVYFNKSSRGNVVEFKESIDGGLTSVNKMEINKEEVLTLLTNGKFQGNNNAESVAQGGFAMAPMMHMKNIEDSKALVIGYGTGMTTRAIHDAGIKDLDLVDLSKDILDLADKYFKNINHEVRNNKNVHTHITDGRNYLKLTSNKYDLISMEITSIWFSGASYLYNQEFYKIAKEKMTQNGVLQQWVQMHHMNPNDFNIILNTIRNEFKYVSVYYIGGQGIIVATNSEENKNPIDNTIKDLNKNKKLEEIKNYYEKDFNSIINKKLLNSDETDKYLTKLYGKYVKTFVSTDENLYLEYKTPKGNVLKIDTEKEIIKLINKMLSK